MYSFLVVLLVLDAVLLILVILAQAGKGGGIAATFGGASSSADSFMGSRQQATLLTKVSWYGGGLFLALGLVLSIMSTQRSAPRSVLDETFGQPAATTPVVPPPGTGGATAVPLEPATPQPQTPQPESPQPQP
jgi:preprotein translocase subunit SecG